MAKVKLPDGTILEAPDGTTVKGFAEQIGPGLAKAALAGKVDEKLVDLSAPVTGEVSLSIITNRSEESLDILRHSCGHIMAEAVVSLWPNAKLAYGSTVDDGFYYDIGLDEPIRPEDFEMIEKKN